MFRSANLLVLPAFVALIGGLVFLSAQGQEAEPLDRAAWGEDHVGKALPDYITGDECLFCHRFDIGETWGEEPHAMTVRVAAVSTDSINELSKVPALKALAEETAYVMGRDKSHRFLRRGQGYGKVGIASVGLTPAAGDRPASLVHAEDASWDEEKFAQSCAGCHMTAVITERLAFQAASIDCYSCHGSVTLDHTTDTEVMLLSRKRKDPANVVASICAQCHLRGGKSGSTGLPYPNQFVPGDNLFKDFVVDLSDQHIATLNPGDRHIFENVRDIVVRGETRVTCLDCHEVHRHSSEIHGILRNRESCQTCHFATGPKSAVIEYEMHSEVCEY